MLIAGEEGQPWCDAARLLADELGLPLDALRIGHLDGDLYDPRSTWARRREIAPDGAVLVRPDRFIAWRSAGPSDSPVGALASAFEQILARPVRLPAAVAL